MAIDIIFNFQKQNDRLKAYSVIGDKMVDFLDSLYNQENNSSEMDRFRQIILVTNFE
ncbi:MAG: hypothetical protein KFW07_03000 [Mycoplasmataceae bacterium]|nr:hypothetical protein [Mycoplasmataceae bacterium]